MNKETKPTVGKLATELMNKELESPSTHTVHEQSTEMMKDYASSLFECVETHKKVFDGDFFVVVIAKKEPLLPNVIRNYFVGRQSCPKPDYDQAVFHYHRKDDGLEYLWVIPDKLTCIMLMDNATLLDDQEKDLLKMVLDFADGTLARKERQLNGIPEPTIN